jgi:hypothetical protein
MQGIGWGLDGWLAAHQVVYDSSSTSLDTQSVTNSIAIDSEK